MIRSQMKTITRQRLMETEHEVQRDPEQVFKVV